MNLLVMALAPGLAIILFIIYRDKFNREPPVVLLGSFFYGVLATLPAVGLEMAAGYFDLQTIHGTVIFAFLGVALVEEAVKFVPLRLYSFTRASFDEPLDGIVHGVMVGMGFATLENILYVYEGGMSAGWIRMFTAVPAHASWGAIMGYYLGNAKFNFNKRTSLLLTGLLLSVFFHGLYDACIFLTRRVDKNTIAVLVAAALTTHIMAVLLAARLIRQHHVLSKGLFKHNSILTIRHATVHDIPLIRTLANQTWPQTYEKILTKKQIRYMMHLIYSHPALEHQMKSAHQFIIIYNNDIPVGFASYSEEETSIYKLHKIYLLINQQSRGTGRFTLEQVITDIQPKGATILRLNVNRHNKAKHFYEKLGFTIIREEKIDIGSGYFMDDYVMELRIENRE